MVTIFDVPRVASPDLFRVLKRLPAVCHGPRRLVLRPDHAEPPLTCCSHSLAIYIIGVCEGNPFSNRESLLIVRQCAGVVVEIGIVGRPQNSPVARRMLMIPNRWSGFTSRRRAKSSAALCALR